MRRDQDARGKQKLCGDLPLTERALCGHCASASVRGAMHECQGAGAGRRSEQISSGCMLLLGRWAAGRVPTRRAERETAYNSASQVSRRVDPVAPISLEALHAHAASPNLCSGSASPDDEACTVLCMSSSPSECDDARRRYGGTAATRRVRPRGRTSGRTASASVPVVPRCCGPALARGSGRDPLLPAQAWGLLFARNAFTACRTRSHSSKPDGPPACQVRG